MTPSLKRSRLALALASPALLGSLVAAMPATVHAETLVPIKLYGFLNAEIEQVQAKGGTTPYQSRGRVTDGNSRLGITGAFTVNDRLKAIWQLEGSLNNFDQGGTDDLGKSQTLTSRNSFVGLEDVQLGRFLVGNYDSAYRSLVGSGGEMGGNLGLSVTGLDLWNNTSAQLTGNAYSVFSRGEARYKNSVHYFSPELMGFSAAASYGFDESRNAGLNRGRMSLAVKYRNGPLQLGVAVDQQQSTGVDIERLQQGFGFRTMGQDGASTRFVKLVGSYKFPTGTYLGAGVEQASYGFTQFVPPSGSNFYPVLNSGRMKQTGTMLSLAQEFGHATVMFSGGQLSKLDKAVFGNENDYKATQFSLGAKYKLNDTLTAYTYFTRIRNKPQQSVNLGQSPLYSVGSGTSDAYLSPGDSPRAIGVGLIANF